jgi:hypothetical protein
MRCTKSSKPLVVQQPSSNREPSNKKEPEAYCVFV